MIRCTNIKKVFGATIVLEIEELEIPKGTNSVVVGQNGAGKSTMLLLVAGLLKPTSGSISIDGSVPGSKQARSKVSFAPDKPALFDDLPLDDQLHYISHLNNSDKPAESCLDLIEAFGAGSLLKKFPRTMSKGQRQKSSLLLAFARPFEVLLLDEPTSGLDEVSQQAFVQVLEAMSATGTTIVSSSHNPDFIERSDRQIQVDDGCTVFVK